MDREIDIQKIAKLARLKLTEKEVLKFEQDLKEVKKMFDEIDKINVKEEPCFQPVEIKNVIREDKIKKGFSLDECFSNTNHKERNLFKGPKV